MARVLELAAAIGRPAILPDDGAMEGLTSIAVPGDRRLALVRDADRCDRLATFGQVSGEFSEGLLYEVEYLSGVVLYPTGSREVLRELSIGDADDVCRVVDG